MSIDFGRAMKDIFSTEKKWMTILGLFVCVFIPVVGQMVAIGYMVRRFMREREGKPAEDFDFNFFVEYLKIGLWPMLATLVASLVLVPIVMIFMIPIFIGAFVVEDNEALGIVLMLLGTVLYVLAIVVATVFFYPIMIRSALTMDFKAGFSWSFMKSFVGKVGMSMIGYYLLLMLVSFPLMLLGYLALFVGVYFVAVWLQFAMFHLVFQHYDLFLDRGGQRVEVHPDITKNLERPPLPPQNPPAPMAE